MLLKIDGLFVSYGEMLALRDVTFEVEDRELVAVVGANGAGKTTLMRAVSGLTRASRGSIRFADRDITRLAPHAIVELGIVQVPEGRKVFPSQTVHDNLWLGGYTRRVRDRRPRNLDRVYSLFPRLRERRGQRAGTLSGGEQQMLALGRALMAEPRLLLLDEPSQGLAPLIVAEMLHAVQGIHRDGTTVLLVEQHVNRALTLATRGYVLENGAITMSGTGAGLLEDAGIRRAYLGL